MQDALCVSSNEVGSSEADRFQATAKFPRKQFCLHQAFAICGVSMVLTRHQLLPVRAQKHLPLRIDALCDDNSIVDIADKRPGEFGRQRGDLCQLL